MVTHRLSGGSARLTDVPQPTLSISPASHGGPATHPEKCKKCVARRRCGRARQQKVLDVVELEHVAIP